jgi:hypothetical protein
MLYQIWYTTSNNDYDSTYTTQVLEYDSTATAVCTQL